MLTRTFRHALAPVVFTLLVVPNATLATSIDRTVEIPEYEYGPDGMFMWVDVPREVEVGELFTMTITVENLRPHARLALDELWIEDIYFTGFEMVTTFPPTEVDEDQDGLELAFELVLEPGEGLEIDIDLRALRPGVFIGDVDLWDTSTHMTRAAQTVVKRPRSRR